MTVNPHLTEIQHIPPGCIHLEHKVHFITAAMVSLSGGNIIGGIPEEDIIAHFQTARETALAVQQSS